ncbi:MAG: hypothetical protein QXL17_04590 [Candidatus Thermoplasmatota archaeon]
MVPWQDIALTAINFGFIITLLPAIIKNYKLKDVTSQSLTTYLSTSLLLTIMAIIFFTLDLPLSCLSTTGTAIVWFIITYQKIAYTKKK